MTTLFYREGRLLSLSILMAVALGLSTLITIGRQEDPTITNLFATVITPFPGAGPGRVEALVTEKLETELRTLPAIKNIDSTSSTGVSSIRIELSEFTPKDEIENIWSEVRDALSDARLPPGALEPEFDDNRVGAFTSISALTIGDAVVGDAPSAGDLAVLSRYARELADRLRRSNGTDFVRVFGASEEEILVEIDPDRLTALGLTPAQVSRAIAGGDAKSAAGRVRGTQSDYLLEVGGEIESVERVRRVPINTDQAAGAPIVRVGDVADVRRAVAEPPLELARVDGERAVLVAARMEPDRQVDTWMAQVRATLDQFESETPIRVSHRQIFDQSAYTFERLAEVAANLAFGVGIVVTVLFITLGWRSALIVGLILPLASLLSLFTLQQIGVVVHQMSVTGLIVALGLLVDAGIVMTDDIRRRLSEGASRLQAVDQAVRRLAAPLLASTVTTILAFVPMAALPGPAGDFVGSIALAVMVMLVCSLGLALTVTPALAGRFLPAPGERADADAPPRARRLGLPARLYKRSLQAALRNRVAAAAAAAAPALIGFAALPILTAQFFPGVERDQFYVQVELQDGAAIAETARVMNRIDARLRDDDDVSAVAWVVGRSAPAFYYNMQPDRDRAPNFAEALVTTTDAAATNRLVAELQPELDTLAPGAQTIVRALVQGPPVAAPLEMRIFGLSVENLRRIGEEARARMSALPSVTHARAQISGGAPKLVFDLDEDKVRLAGLSLEDAAGQLAALIEGAQGGSLVEGSEELPVRVRVGDADRAAADRILELTLSPGGASAMAERGVFPGAPLSALGEMRLEPSDSRITRRNGERVNTVQAFLQPGVLPDEALRELRASLEADPIDLPEGYRIGWGGDSDARNDVINQLLSSVTIVVTLTIATIVLTFNSFRLSLIAFIVAGLSFGLSILSLAVFQYPFGINALIGVIGSIGVSINAAIIIMSALKSDPAAATGDPDAVVDVIMKASRHIISTTITTFGGFLPLIVGGGLFWPPFAMAIAGGVLLSTIVSLYFTPALYSLLAGRKGYGPAHTDGPTTTARAAVGA